MVDFMLIAIVTISEPTITARLVHSVVAVTASSSSARITIAVAGTRMALHSALITPSQIETTNILRSSLPQKAKNFFSVRNITPPPRRLSC